MTTDLRIRIKWQILFRVAFLMTMAVSGAVLRFFYEEPTPEILKTLLWSGFAFSTISFFALRAVAVEYLPVVAWAQIIWDVLYTSVLVYATGGISSAFVMLYVLQILASGGILSSVGALGSGIGAILGLITVIVAQNGFEIFTRANDVPKILLLLSTLSLVGGAVAQFFRSREKLARSLERASSDLRGLNHLYSAIVDHIPSGIMYLDSDRHVRLMNQAALRILGDEWTGRALSGTPLESFLKSEGRFESQVALTSSTKILGHHMTTLPDGGSVVVFQDVTEIRDLEKKMLLKEKLASIGQLAAGVAHEIRNPLASLSGSIQLLKTELKLEPHYEKLMRIVLRETDRLDHLANSFLNYAKPSELQLEEIVVSKVIDEVLSLLKNSNECLSGKVKVNCSVQNELKCVCDPRLFKQILWNLITNAIQSITDRGEVEISAAPSRFEERESIRFVVSDTGEGIDESVKEKIFDPFFTTKVSGSGLGLALVYQMIKSHQGRLGVDSQVGSGTKFWFELFTSGPERQKSAA